MATRSPVRATATLALTALLMACGDENPTGPDRAEFRAPTPQFNAVELLINFTSNGGGTTTGSNPPSFSLSTVPANVDALTAWSRTISIEPNSPFAPDMAVDYGDGSGPKDLNVSQSGGVTVIDPIKGEITTTPVTYSFTLSHTYATPGTYTITAVAATYGDTPSSRYATATITVAPDPELYIDNFQMGTTTVQGQALPFSFDTRGPAGDPYSVTLKYGGFLIQNAFVPANGTYSNSYVWSVAGTHTFTATISNGSRSATVTRQVVVEPAPITITAFTSPGNVSFGEEASFSFKVNGSGPYTATITHGDGSEPTTFSVAAGATVTRTHTWAESGRWPVNIQVTNGFTSATRSDTVTILRPAPTIADFSAPTTLHFFEESVLSFVPNDASDVDAMAYELFITENGGETQSDIRSAERGVAIILPIQAPDYNAVYDLKLIVHSGQNGLVLSSDTVFHTITVEDLVCAAGTYRDGAACVDAPAGSYVPEAGAFEAIPCAPGTYQPQTGQTACIPTPPGSVAPVPGTAQPQLCPVGTYQVQAGASSCIPAQPGRFVDQVGATQATLCAPGTYQPASGQTACVVAPVGTYVDATGAVAATPCPIATSTAGTGSRSAAQCIGLAQIALATIEQAVDAGALEPASAGKGGEQQFSGWLSDLNRSFEFLDGPQRQAGCVGVRNALLRADGLPSPKDAITGPARAGVEATLRRILDEYGCN